MSDDSYDRELPHTSAYAGIDRGVLGDPDYLLRARPEPISRGIIQRTMEEMYFHDHGPRNGNFVHSEVGLSDSLIRAHRRLAARHEYHLRLMLTDAEPRPLSFVSSLAASAAKEEVPQ